MNVQDEIKALKERIAELEELAKEEQEFPQEPKYYARIKGWELIDDERDIMYWMIDKQDNVLFVSERPEFSFGLTGDYGYTTELTANQWNELGIYDDVNAVFILKEEG